MSPAQLAEATHVSPGDSVVVPHSLWPTYTCSELGGSGWQASVVSTTSSTAVVRFLHAQTRDGRPYANERLPLSTLRVQAA